MVRNSCYNGYGQYFVNKSSSDTTRKPTDSDWIRVKKKTRFTKKNHSTSYQNSRVNDEQNVQTRFPIDFLYESDDNENIDNDEEDSNNFECEAKSKEKTEKSKCVHSVEMEYPSDINESGNCLQYSKTNSNGMYVDDDGDQIPELSDIVIEEQFVNKKALNATSIGINAIGRRVSKVFDQGVFAGTVTHYLAPLCGDEYPLWQIVFDDNDEEQWNISELECGMALFNSMETDDIEHKTCSKTSCGVRVVTYQPNTDMESSDSDDDSVSFDEVNDDDSDFECSSSDQSCSSVSNYIESDVINHIYHVYVFFRCQL